MTATMIEVAAPVAEQVCSTCGLSKPLTEQYWHKQGNGFHTVCRSCRNAQEAERTARKKAISKSQLIPNVMLRFECESAERAGELADLLRNSPGVLDVARNFSSVLALFEPVGSHEQFNTIPELKMYWRYYGGKINA